jgi:hypothetical protein
MGDGIQALRYHPHWPMSVPRFLDTAPFLVSPRCHRRVTRIKGQRVVSRVRGRLLFLTSSSVAASPNQWDDANRRPKRGDCIAPKKSVVHVFSVTFAPLAYVASEDMFGMQVYSGT